MKASDGMDYVPVYEEETASGAGAPGAGVPEEIQGLAPVRLSPYKEQLIGVKFAVAGKAPIVRIVRTTGRFAGGRSDFAVLTEDFAARKPLHPSGRYLVADLYALDAPYVRAGQRAFVTALNGTGSRVEGRVASFYPYDQTQSRVLQVKITLPSSAPPGPFADVEIETVTAPKLAVPKSAVLDTGTQKYVFQQTATGVFTPRRITVGLQGDSLLEVTSGLKPGDHVVDGADFLIDADSKLKAAFSDEK